MKNKFRYYFVLKTQTNYSFEYNIEKLDSNQMHRSYFIFLWLINHNINSMTLPNLIVIEIKDIM